MPAKAGIPLLEQIKEVNEQWFSPGNKKFFNDVSYKAYYGKKTHSPYLVSSTYAWTDMFGKPPRLHWRINNINGDTLHIENLINREFEDMEEVKVWLEDM